MDNYIKIYFKDNICIFHRQHRYELIEEPKKCNIIFIDEKLAIKVIMDCRKNKTKEQYKNILTKVLTKIMSSLEGENMQTQYNVLGYRIDSYFHNYKLSIEMDNGQ